jgi:hypothetical protein
MSSCSEYLVRQQLRAPKYTDTRPKMTCGQMIEIQRQQANAVVYEQFLPATACVNTLNAPSTRSAPTRTIARGHRVQDASAYMSYASSSASAAMWNSANAKATSRAQQIAPGVSQIRNENCLAPRLVTSLNGVMPNTQVNQLMEIGDKMVMSTLLDTTDPNYRKEDIIAAARQAIGPNCCVTCGIVSWRVGKVNFATTCTACKGVNAGDTNADGTLKFKGAFIYPTAIS